MKKIFIVVLATALFGCQNTNSSTNKKRIISASKQFTEIIYALGAQENLVGVDLSSTYPPQAQKLPNVGYHMKLSLEGMLSLNPTEILHKGGKWSIGPATIVDQLNELKVPMYSFKNKAKDIASTQALITEMGVYFDKENDAKMLNAILANDMKKVHQNVDSNQVKPKVLVLHYGRAMNIYMAVGTNSTAGKMIKWAGGEMALTGESMTPITAPEIIAESNPDIVLVTDFGFDQLGSVEKVKTLPGLAVTKAAKNNRIYRYEAHDLIYLGPRTGKNILKLQKLLHHEAEQ